MTIAAPQRTAIVKPLSSGGAKLGRVLLGAEGLQTSDFLNLRRGGREIFARPAWGFGARPADGEVLLDDWQRAELAASVNDAVEWRRVPMEETPTLTHVLLATTGPLPASVAPEQIREFIERHRFPLYRRFRFEFNPLGTRKTVTFQVQELHVGTNHARFGVCGRDTQVQIKPGGAGDLVNGHTIDYSDLGGLDREIQLVRESIELPMRMRNALSDLGVTAPAGLIFHGPPGTGKTLLARALAHAAGVPIHEVSACELIARHAGAAETALQAVFDEAESHVDGSIVLIDELDAIAGTREGGASGLANVLRGRMDGLRRRGHVVVIGTTNRIGAIDEALRRHGRFSREIPIAAPDEAGRREILHIQARRMLLDADTEAERDALLADLARRTHGFVGADLMELCREAGLSALRRAHPVSNLDHGHTSPAADLTVVRADFERALGVIKPSALKEALISIPNVTFADIAGLDHVIEDIRARLAGPLLHPEVFAAMGLAAERGILLHGPPGTGKTMLAKAIAHECNANFLAVQGPELLSKWIGESEEGIRRIFARARQLAPSLIYFDEVEALLPVRGIRPGDCGVMDRVVNQFLAELDGIAETAGVTVLAATNRPELLDPAVLRPGRLGIHIRIPLPSAAGRRAILARYLDGALPLELVSRLAGETEGFSGADLWGVCRDARLLALREVEYARAVAVTETHLRESIRRHRTRLGSRRTESPGYEVEE